jgi:hypothetical protein
MSLPGQQMRALAASRALGKRSQKGGEPGKIEVDMRAIKPALPASVAT